MAAPQREPAGFRVGDLTIDLGTRQVSRAGQTLPLPRLSFELLLALIRRAPNVLTVDELMAEVWAGRVVNEETVAKRIELVREALGDDSKQSRYIALVRGHGYRLTAPVEASDSHARAADDAPSPRLALAVLPLDDLSGDAEGYFAAGMHDALITDLSKARALKVISRTSTLPYQKTNKPLPTIAAELGVDLIIEGSVLRADDRVRITVQLIAANDEHVWAQSYDGDLGDVLRLQSEVARAVSEAVKLNLTPAERTRMTARRRVDVASYELYLKGRYFLDRMTPGGVGNRAGATAPRDGDRPRRSGAIRAPGVGLQLHRPYAGLVEVRVSARGRGGAAGTGPGRRRRRRASRAGRSAALFSLGLAGGRDFVSPGTGDQSQPGRRRMPTTPGCI